MKTAGYKLIPFIAVLYFSISACQKFQNNQVLEVEAKELPKMVVISKEDSKKHQFFSYGPLHQLLRWEVADARALTSFQTKDDLCQPYADTGEILTCVGITFKYHPDWFLETLDTAFEFGECVSVPHRDGRDIRCKGMGWLRKNKKAYHDLLEKILHKPGWRKKVSDFYWKNYAKKYFMNCSFRAASYLFDSAMLTGHPRAMRIIQKAHGLKVDSKWGPQTIQVCQDGVFKPGAYIETEIATFKTFRLFKKYGKGWVRRIKGKVEKTDKGERLIKYLKEFGT